MCVSKQVVNQGQDLEIGKQDTFSSFIDNYSGPPDRRTCAFIYFYDKNGTCAGLLGTVHLLKSLLNKQTMIKK